MPSLGVLTLEVRIEESHSLKDRRQVVKSLKDRLRHSFNVSVAEIDGEGTWQRATIAVATVSGSRSRAEAVLQAVERQASDQLGRMLVDVTLEWLD